MKCDHIDFCQRCRDRGVKSANSPITRQHVERLFEAFLNLRDDNLHVDPDWIEERLAEIRGGKD